MNIEITDVIVKQLQKPSEGGGYVYVEVNGNDITRKVFPVAMQVAEFTKEQLDNILPNLLKFDDVVIGSQECDLVLDGVIITFEEPRVKDCYINDKVPGGYTTVKLYYSNGRFNTLTLVDTILYGVVSYMVEDNKDIMRVHIF